LKKTISTQSFVVGSKRILSQISRINRIENVLADGGYSGKLQRWFHRKNKGNKRLFISKKLAKKDFKVIPKRWIVERTFAWFEHQRRLAKDL
jgi:putative transposase